MKTISTYLVLRVDLDIPDDMSEQDAKEETLNDYKYDFSLSESSKIAINNTEICGYNN
jgi:hypothetical protein